MAKLEDGTVVETLPETDLKSPPPGENVTGAAIDRAIQSWLVSEIYNSQVSASTEVYNHLARTLPALKERLEAELAKQ
jgi:hypothetical protein